MKTIDAFNISPQIRARQSDRGIWYLRHRDLHGKSIEYSTGVKGSRTEIKQHVKAAGVHDLVAVTAAGCLSTETIQRITGNTNINLLGVICEWDEHMGQAGEADSTRSALYKRMIHLIKHSNGVTATSGVGAIEISHIHAWVNNEFSGLKLATRRARLTTIKSFFKFCVAKGYTFTNPAALVKVNMNIMTHAQKETKKQEAITLVELYKIIRYVDQLIDNLKAARLSIPYSGKQKWRREDSIRDKIKRLSFWGAASILSFETGLRLGDVAQLERDSFSADAITVWTDKRDRRVSIPMDMLDMDLIHRCARYLLDYGHCTSYMFPMHKLLVTSGKSDHLSMQFRRLADKVGISKSFHGFRHSRIERWHDKGLSLEAIAELVAHKSTKTTLAYL